MGDGVSVPSNSMIELLSGSRDCLDCFFEGWMGKVWQSTVL